MHVSSYPTLEQTVGIIWASTEMAQPCSKLIILRGTMCCFRVDGWQLCIRYNTCAVLDLELGRLGLYI
jgi:hypothetical protein